MWKRNGQQHDNVIGPQNRPMKLVATKPFDYIDDVSSDATDAASVDPNTNVGCNEKVIESSYKSNIQEKLEIETKYCLADCRRRLEEVYYQKFSDIEVVNQRITRTLKKVPTVERLAKLITRKYGWGSNDFAKHQKCRKEQQRDIGKKRKLSAISTDLRNANHKTLVCDKCDANHDTVACPYYNKARKKHPDAQKRSQIVNIGGDGGDRIIRSNAVVVHRQPGDGSCLYHSLRRGLGETISSLRSTQDLRHKLAEWVTSNRNFKISDTPVSEWVRWDACCSVDMYARRMCKNAWGGGIELAACANKFCVRVLVWERCSGGFKRISSFSVSSPRKTINVLYCGGVHYDYLEVKGSD